MMVFCKTNIPGIEFFYISKERMEEVRLKLKGKICLGSDHSRSYHFFKPVSSNVIAYKRTVEDDDAFAGSFNITGETDFDGMNIETVRFNEYVACRYDEK